MRLRRRPGEARSRGGKAPRTLAGRPGKEDSREFRADIQGLRAIAVLLVALCHAQVPGLEGGYIGVDVFFVISGFLITSWLLRETKAVGRLPVGRFYSARARRILPAAALTLVTTCVTSYLLLNYVRALAVVHDAVWAAFFFANVHFARIGTDYFSSGAPPSPLQHFWSLAVEEQFYVVWPALMALILYASRAGWFRRSRRDGDPKDGAGSSVDGYAMRRLALTLVLAVVVSFTWSVLDTSSDQVAAYFSTFARAWELGVGALVAIGAPGLAALSARLRIVMGWVGLGGIFVAATVFNQATAFPGYAAALPVLSAALVLVGGIGGGATGGVNVLLSRQPLRFIGDASYSFYLWHWPALIIAAGYEGHALSTGTDVMVLGVAFALSSVTYLLFENPIRRARFFSFKNWALMLWPVSVASVALTAALTTSSIDALATNGVNPSVLTRTLPVPKTSVALPWWEADVLVSVTPARLAMPVPTGLSPPLLDLSNDFFFLHQCGDRQICHFGDPSARRTMVVFGDSHAEMWMPDFVSFAKTHHWDLIPIVKPGCVGQDWSGRKEPSWCQRWDFWALRAVRQLRPDVIALSTEYSHWIGHTPSEWRASIDGARHEIDALAQLRSDLVVVEDPLFLPEDPTTCLLARSATLGSCTFPLPSWYLTMNSAVAAFAVSHGASFIPTIDWFCARGKCPTVVDDTITHIDGGHVSKTYATELSPAMAAALVTAIKPLAG
jgi:peptidoglycan/LPS O-acetylase OafA/YrhL